MEEKPKRRWLRFSIRDLVWLTLLCGLLLTWRKDRESLKNDVQDADDRRARVASELRRRLDAEMLVRQGELRAATMANQKSPGAISDSQIKLLTRRVNEVKAAAAKDYSKKP